ncbi:MAG: SMP-30/gluconolactonase/LRE family protein [Thermoplasmatota archaeon]
MRSPVLLVVGLLAYGFPMASAQTQADCDIVPFPVLFTETETSLENLAFDGNGSLFLSDAGSDRILRYGPDGQRTGAIDLDAHGIVWGPDDRLYAAVTAGELNDILRSTDASATAFEVYASGLPVYNGMEFDSAWNLYVSDDNIAPPEVPPDLVRIPRDDPSKWVAWSGMYGPDGIVYDPASDALYTVVPADQASPVWRFSPTDPEDAEVVAYLSFGAADLAPGVHEPEGDPSQPVPKGLDDLTLGPDGRLYIAAHLSGELLRFDPATGESCLLASGLEEPSSVRIARGFGEHGGKLFVTTFGGTGVSGLALGQAGMPPAGKVWMFDVGFVEDAATGTVAAPAEASPTNTPDNEPSSPTPPADGGKASPGPSMVVSLAALALGALAIRRRLG